MKLFAFEPNGHGQLSFYIIAENEKEAFELVDKYVKENYFKNNKYDYEAEGWGTTYYILRKAKKGEVIENY